MVVLGQNIYHHHHNAAKSKKLQPVVVVSAPPRCRPASAASISEKVSSAVRLMALVIQKITAVAAERGNRIVGRSLDELMLRHNTALGCSSHDVRMSFVSPRDVEFSCTSSPPRHAAPRRRRRGGGGAYDYHSSLRRRLRRQHYWSGAAVEPAPPAPAVLGSSARSTCSSRRGGGGEEEEDGEFHVDKAADEFIERFYRELMMQKWAAAREGSDRYG